MESEGRSYGATRVVRSECGRLEGSEELMVRLKDY